MCLDRGDSKTAPKTENELDDVLRERGLDVDIVLAIPRGTLSLVAIMELPTSLHCHSDIRSSRDTGHQQWALIRAPPPTLLCTYSPFFG